MKKRLLSLVLALLMSVSCFLMTGCGSDEDDEKEKEKTSVRVATTLTLWLPAAEGTEIDDESVVNVENAINEYTQKTFSTAIKLKVFNADEYDDIVLSRIFEIKSAEDAKAAKEAAERKAKREAREAAKAAESTAPDTTAEEVPDTAEAPADVPEESADAVSSDDVSTPAAEEPETADSSEDIIEVEEETVNPDDYILPLDEDGKKVYEKENEFDYMNASLFTSYPAVENNQFDIFLVHGYDEFSLLNGEYLLSDLTDSITTTNSRLFTYINNELLNSVLVEGSYYCLPNNRTVGKYDYLLLNKNVCEELSYDVDELITIDSNGNKIPIMDKFFNYTDNSTVSFFEDVKKNCPRVVPVAGTYNIPNIKYFNSDDDNDFSIIGAQVSENVRTYDSFEMTNALRIPNVEKGIGYQKRIKEICGDTPDIMSTGEFGVGFFNGTLDEVEEFMSTKNDEYELAFIQTPKITREDAFETCYAVSAYSKDPARAMEIITAINTNTELRTILQYGKEGVHWRHDVEDTSVIQILSDKYKMDMNEIGNVFITYPEAGVPISGWDIAKYSNTGLIRPYTYGFNCVTEDTKDLMKELDGKSADIFARINSMSYAEFRANLESLRSEIDSLDCFKKLTYVYGSDTEKDKDMIYEQCLPSIFLDYVNERGW